MKTSFALFVVACLAASLLYAQDDSVQEAQFKVFGNCGMCKTRIEKSVGIDAVKYVKWNKSTKMLRVAYLSSAITLDSLHQRIAAVGHDTEHFTAPDSVYSQLPGCCRYRDGANTH